MWFILDYYLPDANGEELLEEFYSKNSNAVYIIITASADPELAVRIVKKGASAYIRKPFESGYLLELMSRMIKERALLKLVDVLKDKDKLIAESEAKYQSLVENIDEVLFIQDLEGNLYLCKSCD